MGAVDAALDPHSQPPHLRQTLAQLTAHRLWQQLASRSERAVFFLHGAEEHLREEAVRRIVAAYLEPATRDFNFDQLRGPDVTPEKLGSVLATPPMMAEHRVVVLREVQGLSPKARETVQAAAESPVAGLILILSAQIPANSKAKFYDVLRKTAASVEFAMAQANDLPGWLIERAQDSHGMEMELDAARAMAGSIGPQLGILASELDKLASYADDRGKITIADVRAVGGYVPRVDRWAWFDRIAERRIDESLRLLPELLESGENAVGLLIGVTGQILRVGLAVAGGREALERELPPRQRWLANRLAPLARHWTIDEIDFALDELLRTDRLLKTASLTDRQAMEELLLRLAERLQVHAAA